MSGLTRSVVESWQPAGPEGAARDLEDVRETFLDDVGAARSAPERADLYWVGVAAEACRERLAEEVESARKVAIELEDVADTLRSAARRLGSARAAVLAAVADIEADRHGLIVHDDWEVNVSALAFVPTASNDPESVRRAMAERQDQVDGAVAFLVEEDADCAQILADALDIAADVGRRHDHAATFERATGRLPETPNDWLTASMLDPTSEADKYDGVDAVVRMAHIEPQPGKGIVRTELYIPVESVTNLRYWTPAIVDDLGDDRSAEAISTTGDSRVEIVTDYENGLVVARQNPSVSEEGEVRVDAPLVAAQQLRTGDVRVAYDAGNPFAPPVGEWTHRVEGDFALVSAGDDVRAAARIGEYPSMEMWHHPPDGDVARVEVREAENRSSIGPLLDLPRRQSVGDLALFESFEDDSDPMLSYRKSGDPLPDRPGEVRLGPIDDHVSVPQVRPVDEGE